MVGNAKVNHVFHVVLLIVKEKLKRIKEMEGILLKSLIIRYYE